ncbi:hypothetical protein N431DRAFT_353041 [Stipitochalara longipes BDJ]|nr:hypothetical protein N431DRAFT_353041 [Stipitochalara longipes BDJ]
MAQPQPSLPPLSTTEPPRHRRSKSMEYNNSAPEWYWKLNPILPQLWIRDSSLITPAIISELETAWLTYQTLAVPGKGDGGSRRAKTKAGRRKIEEEYSILEPEIRRAKEVALARHENFAIRGRDGSLDYHIEEAKEKRGLGTRAKGPVVMILGSREKLGD